MNHSETETTAWQGQVSVERGEILAALSDAIVSIHKQFYGKGPERARTHMHRDLVVVLLNGGFTRGEQTLTDRGRARDVVQSRLAMQSAVEAEFRSAVESILSRSVRSFMSANDPTNDLQVEIFVLRQREAEPASDGAPSEAAPAIPASVEGDLAERAHRVREQHRELLDEHRALRSEQEQSRRALHREHGQHE